MLVLLTLTVYLIKWMMWITVETGMEDAEMSRPRYQSPTWAEDLQDPGKP